MAVEKGAADVYECDGCGARKFAMNFETPLGGYQGSVAHTEPWGGSGGDWFACKTTCIQKAVVKATTRRDNG